MSEKIRLSHSELAECVKKYSETGCPHSIQMIIGHYHDRIVRCMNMVVCDCDDYYDDVYGECVLRIMEFIKSDKDERPSIPSIVFQSYLSLKYQMNMNYHSCIRIHNYLMKKTWMTTSDITKLSEKYGMSEYIILIMYNIIQDNIIRLDYDTYDEMEPDSEVIYDGVELGDDTFSPEEVLDKHSKLKATENLITRVKKYNKDIYGIMSGQLKYKDLKGISYFKFKKNEEKYVSKLQQELDISDYIG